MVVRDNYFRMMKQGRFRAVRNLPVGWVTQVLHSTDKTERNIRLLFEILVILIIYALIEVSGLFAESWKSFLLSVAVTHTLMWFFIGNFWVYMLDSFSWVRNPGIGNTLKYMEHVKRMYEKSGSCDAILIYGSMSRRMFHSRSDLDLRVLRKQGLINGIKAVLVGFLARFPALITANPVDFQVVDSIGFLSKQMRDDERPIVVYQSSSIDIENPGIGYEEIKKNPGIVMRDNSDIKH